MCGVGVVLGAFGAHGLRDRLAATLGGGVDELEVAGIAIFSGSLYLLSVTGARWLGAITPIGGLCLIAGWVVLAVGALRGAS